MGPFFPEELTTFMTRTFRHEFDPPEEDPIAGHDDVELTVQEFEDAGVHEVLKPRVRHMALGQYSTLYLGRRVTVPNLCFAALSAKHSR